jgi:hypothetical protein
LKTKQKHLKLQDIGNKPKRACPPTDEEINILKTFIRKRRRSIIDIGYGSYLTPSQESKNTKSSSGIYIGGS